MHITESFPSNPKPVVFIILRLTITVSCYSGPRRLKLGTVLCIWQWLMIWQLLHRGMVQLAQRDWGIWLFIFYTWLTNGINGRSDFTTIESLKTNFIIFKNSMTDLIHINSWWTNFVIN